MTPVGSGATKTTNRSQHISMNVCTNRVFSVQFVTIASSEFHDTVVSILHNPICRLLSEVDECGGTIGPCLLDFSIHNFSIIHQ